MLTLQQLLDIAMRHATRMSDALILACHNKAFELGIRLHAPTRAQALASAAGKRPEEDVDWERMVSGNSDTKRHHV